MRRFHGLIIVLSAGLSLAGVVPLFGQDATPPPAPVTGKPPTQAEVLDKMLRDQPPPPSEAVATRTGGAPPPAPTVNLAELLHAPLASLGPVMREGKQVFSHRARLVRVGGDQKIPVLVFHSETRAEPLRPMLVQPNRKLEELEAMQAKDGPDASFIVSGQVAAYRGNNYLLLTRVQAFKADGNLE